MSTLRLFLAYALLTLALAGCAPRDARITVNPPDAEVLLDGTPVPGHGEFPLALSNQDRHTLEIRKKGYQAFTGKLWWTNRNVQHDPEILSVLADSCCCAFPNCCWNLMYYSPVWNRHYWIIDIPGQPTDTLPHEIQLKPSGKDTE